MTLLSCGCSDKILKRGLHNGFIIKLYKQLRPPQVGTTTRIRTRAGRPITSTLDIFGRVRRGRQFLKTIGVFQAKEDVDISRKLVKAFERIK